MGSLLTIEGCVTSYAIDLNPSCLGHECLHIFQKVSLDEVHLGKVDDHQLDMGAQVTALFIVGCCGGMGGGSLSPAPLCCGDISPELKRLSPTCVRFPSASRLLLGFLLALLLGLTIVAAIETIEGLWDGIFIHFLRTATN